jgi:hypothetical protein
VESDVATGFDVDRAEADFTVGDSGQAGDLVLEAVVS